MKFHGAKGQWPSLQLCHNCHVGPHKDVNNLAGSLDWVIAFGDFNQGGLWLEQSSVQTEDDGEPGAHETVLSDGTKAKGEIVNIRHHMTSFSPKTRHAVEQWSGNRCSIVAYATRGINELARPERDAHSEVGAFRWDALRVTLEEGNGNMS